MKKSEIATKLHQKGYNCAQSVACAFADEVNIPKETLFALCEGFGAGMGSTEATCGALSGAVVIAGAAASDKNTESPASKQETYRLAAEICERFKDKAKSLVCKEIKGTESGEPLCSCACCIESAADIADEVLNVLWK